MRIDVADLKLLGMIISEPGMKLYEQMIHDKIKMKNDMTRITGNVHEDGVLKGEVIGHTHDFQMIREIRRQLAELSKEEKDE